MARLILTRLGVALATLLAASVVVFAATEALPGDAAQAALGQFATPQLLKQERHDLGLDRPLITRYGDWLWGFVRGDLGASLATSAHTSVSTLIADKARNTAVLALATLGLLIPLSIGLGVLSAVRRGGVMDHAIAGTTLALLATPEFVLGTLIAVIAGVWLAWLPPVSLVDASRPIGSQLRLLILPVVTLLAVSVAQTTRMVRATMIEALRSKYVEMATLKGVRPCSVLFQHALPNTLGPTIQILAFNAGRLVGGLVIVETVFQYPGLGLALTNAVATRDLPTVEAITMLITGSYIVINFLADVGAILLNPRQRRSRS